GGTLDLRDRPAGALRLGGGCCRRRGGGAGFGVAGRRAPREDRGGGSVDPRLEGAVSRRREARPRAGGALPRAVRGREPAASGGGAPGNPPAPAPRGPSGVPLRPPPLGGPAPARPRGDPRLARVDPRGRRRALPSRPLPRGGAPRPGDGIGARARRSGGS